MAPKKQETIIAIMGATGVGKSKMVDNLTQSTNWSGQSLRSVTQKVRSTRVRIQGQDVTLVDTPGFDDTHKSDLETLQVLADWLSDTYRRDVCLSGILYLHRITDNRMAGTPYRNLKMFGKLCGGEQEVGQKVTFVTTMWDRVQREKASPRERELKQFWQPMLDLGATMDRSDGQASSAQRIVGKLLQRASESNKPVLIQDEVVTLNRDLIETEAAQTLYNDFQRLLQQHKQTLSDLEQAARNTNNPEQAKNLQEERQRIEAQLERTFAEAKRLKLGWTKRFMRIFQKKAKGTGLELGGNE